MNYYEWSKEYEQTAAELDKVVTRLKNERTGKCRAKKKELNEKIALYRGYRNECLNTANHLLERHLGVA